MRFRVTSILLPRWMVFLISVLAAAAIGCGQPDPANRYRRPDTILDFGKLYGQNCAGCHGLAGRLGAAPPLADPLFLAIVSDEELRQVLTRGRPGTPMPAFDQKEGGPLTTQQVGALIDGMRAAWGARTDAYKGKPSYRQTEPGNATQGAQAFVRHCVQCHGVDGKGGDKAGAIHDHAFLALASDQRLRRTVITGRSDLGMPGCADRDLPMTEQEIADVVALLALWRGGGPELGPQPRSNP